MKILYVAYENAFLTGILQSQVLELLVRLKALGCDASLFTVCKAHDRESQIYQKNRSRFAQSNINFVEFRKTLGKQPSMFRFFVDLIPMIVSAIRASGSVDLIHARSYGGAALALVVSKLTGKPYIFDMRGVLPEELVRVGKLRRSSITFRLMKFVERQLVFNASYVFTVSQPFSTYVAETFGVGDIFNISNPTTPLSQSAKKITTDARINFVYNGSAQPWHLAHLTLCVFALVRKQLPNCHLTVLSGDVAYFTAAIQSLGLSSDSFEVRHAPFEDIPSVLRDMHVGFCLREPGFESSVSCPVKFGEYCANNIFVITNESVGDLPSLVGSKFCGIVFKQVELSQPEYIADRIRRSLEEGLVVDNVVEGTNFDWDVQSRKVVEIYRSIVAKRGLTSGSGVPRGLS